MGLNFREGSKKGGTTSYLLCRASNGVTAPVGVQDGKELDCMFHQVAAERGQNVEQQAGRED